LLLGDAGRNDSYDDDTLLGRCVEIEGTLVGCRPEGVLAGLLKRLSAGALGTDQAWLGDVAITEPEPPPGTPPCWSGEDLGDVVALGQRPSTIVPGTMVLSCFPHPE
jgi:hypothetical protein